MLAGPLGNNLSYWRDSRGIRIGACRGLCSTPLPSTTAANLIDDDKRVALVRLRVQLTEFQTGPNLETRYWGGAPIDGMVNSPAMDNGLEQIAELVSGMQRRAMKKKVKITCGKKPNAHDYPAAESYLSLIFQPKVASELVRQLRKAPVTPYIARDILRALGHSLLGIKDSDDERRAFLAGKRISPILLVRNECVGNLIVPDGYYRLCTV